MDEKYDGGLHSTQFLLKRLDPKFSNEVYIHSLLGEIDVNGTWKTYSRAIIHSNDLALEILGMVHSIVNSESRLGEVSSDKAHEIAMWYALNLNTLLFFKGDEYVKKKFDYKTKEGKIKTRWEYIDDEGSPENEIDENGDYRENEEFKGKVTCMEIESYPQIVLSSGDYVYLNLTRPVDRSEAKLISEIVKINEQTTTETRNKEGGLFNTLKNLAK